MVGLLGVLLICQSVVFANADGATIEQVMTDKVQRTLDRVFGQGQFVGIVSVEMNAPSYEMRYTRQSQAAMSRQTQSSGTKMQILPGYPVIRNLAPDTMKQLPFDSVTRYAPATLRRIKLTLIVNKSFPRNTIQKAQELVQNVLGMVSNRDTTTIMIQSFADDKPTSMMSFMPKGSKESGTASSSPLFIVGIWAMVVAVGAFMIVYVVFQIRRNGIMSKMVMSQGDKEGAMSQPMMQMVADTGSRSSDKEAHVSVTDTKNSIRQYFDFVTDQTIDRLLFILDKETIAVENLAILIPCLSPHLARKVMVSLDPKTQAIVAVNMTQPRLFAKAMIEKFETQLKNAMESLIGGKTIAQAILGHLSHSHKKNLMDVLSSNQEGYHRIRPFVLLFDDLILLTDAELQQVIGAVHRDILATALVFAQPQLYQKFDQNFSKSQRALVQEFIQLRSGSLSQPEVDHAQDAVLESALSLDEQGRIQFRQKL